MISCSSSEMLALHPVSNLPSITDLHRSYPIYLHSTSQICKSNLEMDADKTLEVLRDILLRMAAIKHYITEYDLNLLGLNIELQPEAISMNSEFP